MPDVQFRVFFDDGPATQSQLDRIEEITVEQEENIAWQATIVFPLCVGEDGSWSAEDEDFMQSFGRVRVEIKVGDNEFIPLIDGPISGHDRNMDSQPGQSRISLMVLDDSVYLDRVSVNRTFQGKTDKEIAEELFQSVDQISETDADDTPPAETDASEDLVRRGTAMQILRNLAQQYGMQAYVLPGDEPGQSIGKFKEPMTTDSGHEPLVLLGADRNILNFNVQHNAQNPSTYTASRLNFSDKVIRTETSSFQDVELLGDETADDETAEEQLSPYHSQTMDLAQAVMAPTLDSSYSLTGSGKVIGSCYPDVLRPYETVCIRGANGRLSGVYLLTRVTHKLTRNEYSQEFSVKRNAESAGSDSDDSSLSGGLSASFSLDINISGGIF